ncbi:hypothetical protein DN402_06590 [Streptomyces sp. SW4]|nr:hypothetical protein DN402_06590 [Streptomyces sp. SW4]
MRPARGPAGGRPVRRPGGRTGAPRGRRPAAFTAVLVPGPQLARARHRAGVVGVLGDVAPVRRGAAAVNGAAGAAGAGAGSGAGNRVSSSASSVASAAAL